jgi:hypothetical protein
MLNDCASTRIDDDSSDEFDPASVVDGLMPPQSMFGRLHDTFACYRQLHAVAGSSMESQSRGAIHVHSMAPFAGGGNSGVEFFSEFYAKEPYRQGIASSRHAETQLAMGGVLGEHIEKRQSLRRDGHVPPQLAMGGTLYDLD